ncbi:hypothetical protein OE749_09525 [Aestuariibacter sp. AA17]|uniref:Uncharacterized protein n=1 Tax=Fluctibacter corallii TaxID=2984329 RepID=A0ABT3A8C3_9ALTE|nr:hypothetical protein [Aestuariibacter sp. AA17]MCV2884935.1 hypothetical protein [Aestuariibacter sp. AA17]
MRAYLFRCQSYISKIERATNELEQQFLKAELLKIAVDLVYKVNRFWFDDRLEKLLSQALDCGLLLSEDEYKQTDTFLTVVNEKVRGIQLEYSVEMQGNMKQRTFGM